MPNTLLTASAAATGASLLFRPTAAGASAWLFVTGTWNSATAKLQASADGVTWVDIVDASFTANGVIELRLAGFYVRGVVTGGNGSTAITMTLI